VIWIFLVVGVLLVLGVWFVTANNELVPWLDKMTRLHAGVRHRAEWIAPYEVLEAVKRDYLSFYDYAARTLPQGWLAYLQELEDYLCGEALLLQRQSLEARLRHDRGRLVEVLRAQHQLYVRHFSDDGLTCIVIDQQSEIRLATYDYWRGQRLHTQNMGRANLVYQMRYDPKAGRWKRERFIQHLPPQATPPTQLALHLPTRNIRREQ